MAVVLDALAPYVKKMIMDMGEEEVRMLLGVSDEIKKLEGNVGYLQNYLADAERRRITDRSVQVWVGKLKDAMYEAADILELCQLEAMERQEYSSDERDDINSSCLCSLQELLREKLQSVLEPFLFCMNNPRFAHDMGSRIKNLNEKLDGIRKDAAEFKFINLSPYDERRRSPTQPRRKTTSGFDESAIVGDKIQKDAEELLQKLIANRSTSHGSSAVKIVSIAGQGGMGKSTLARKIFASEAIKEEFKTKIWLSVTQHFDTTDLLRSAIAHAGEKHADEKDESILQQTLTDVLSKKKFLLVLDDVWDDGAWNNVLRVPVINAGRKQPGSRVLVTTRKEDVVLRMGGSSRDQLHVNRLDDEDAWYLLKKQLPQSEVNAESEFDQLKDIGMEIIKKCDGLPLAIKVMGGLLSTRRLNERDWEIVLDKNFEWKEEGLQEELNYSVHLSYDDLSPQLKQCFLYYSLLPKSSAFNEDVVISMWISEGFIQHDGGSESCQLDLEDIGTEYHRELVERNLLEPDDSTWTEWNYTMHDIVRSFAQFMASEEAFVVHTEQADIRSLLLAKQKKRRLSIELTDSSLEWNVLENQKALRTLLIMCDIRSGGSLANFGSLRVLHITSLESDWLVDSLCQLRHLRYLSFSRTDISRLPNDIHTLRFLEHIQLEDCKKLNKLPDSITKLMQLRFISWSNIDVVPRGFSALTNLRSVYGFSTKMDGDWCTLEELGTLTHLRSLQIESLENVPDSSTAAKAMISNKKHLTYLELNCFKEEEEDGIEEENEEEKEEYDRSEDDEEDEQTEDYEEAKEEHNQSEDDEQTKEEDGDEEENEQIEKAKDEHYQSEDDEEDEEVKEEHYQSEDDEEDEEAKEKDEDDEQTEDDQEEEEIEEIEEKTEDKEQIDEEHKQRIEEVFNALCPPAYLETLSISRYFGCQLPNWMHASTVASFKSLRTINLLCMSHCTQLPNGLCRILCLEKLYINDALAIKFVGPDFQTPASGDGGGIVTTPFPKLRELYLLGLFEWKNWDWEEEQDEGIAMPALEYLRITDCKLSRLPPGLASNNRYNLRTLLLEDLSILTCVENFPSVVEFHVLSCPKLKRISGLSKLRTIYIYCCPKLKLLEGVPLLDSMVLDDEPWEVTGAPAKCTPKGYHAGQLHRLPQNLTVNR